MNFNEYQELSKRTMPEPSIFQESIYALGLAGETGEVVEVIKKHLGHGKSLSRAELEEELGDILFYLSAIATTYNIKLEDIARTNVGKLKLRYPNGFKKHTES